MKMKLAALLAATMLSLAGCGGASTNSTNTTNSTNASNVNKTSSTTSKPDENTVAAKADATSEVGGTKEGCKCSAAGMKCSTKAGEKGCCGKDGECSSMVDGKSSCCASKGSADAACCSTAGKVAMEEKNTGEKSTAAPAGKKG
ncbi:MAG: hypothetical protein DMF68_03980 [Acidobacteria bacterium]|nr:MAG: hypothetical protein DMF68_03980 [Acidobacteriota bacterium]